MDLVGVVAHDRDPRPRLRERSRRVRRLAEHRRADDQNRVVGREPLPQARPVGGEDAREEPVILGKARPGAERLLEDRRDEPFRELGQRCPGLGVVGAGADDERGRSGTREEGDELVDRGRVRGGAPHDSGRRRVLALLVGGDAPVVHRGDHERRPAVGGRLVRRPPDRAREILRLHGLVDPDRVLAGEALEPAGEERLEGQVPPVLLADEHDQRRPVDARGCEGADRVAEAGRGVEQGKGGLAAADRPPRCQADHGRLMQSEHEAQVLGESGEERNLRRSRVAEDRRQALLPQDVEGRVTHGPAAHRRQYPAAESSV